MKRHNFLTYKWLQVRAIQVENGHFGDKKSSWPHISTLMREYMHDKLLSISLQISSEKI